MTAPAGTAPLLEPQEDANSDVTSSKNKNADAAAPLNLKDFQFMCFFPLSFFHFSFVSRPFEIANRK
jgi:hypothetical protein